MSVAYQESPSAVRRYYGKYRGTVLNNIDPLNKGRLMVTVPDVLGAFPSTWALPCVPLAGIKNGFYALPLIGSGVWIEFEQGDPDFPIWVGCFWGSATETPPLAKIVPPAVPGITLQSFLGHGLVISDLPGPTGGILLKCASGASISISDLGIVLDNGRGACVKLIGATVDVNNQALTVI